MPLSPVKLGATIPDFNPKDVYCVVLAVNPNNINKIMALGEEGYYSSDGAATWAKKMDVFTTYKSRQTYVHSDHHFAEFIDDTTVLVGHDGGVSLINTKADPFGHTDITGNMIISQIYRQQYIMRIRIMRTCFWGHKTMADFQNHLLLKAENG
ncbi:MAG: hypothetical protein IPP01_00065 [Saprospiraceae bacterium]|nr:hypothetical protein [Saprospiraceae bacterium]